MAFSLFYAATVAVFGGFEIKILVLALPLIWLSFRDLADHIIPDLAVLAVAAWGIVTRDPVFSLGLYTDLCMAGAVLGILWIVGEIYWRRTGLEALGFGDAKLIAASMLCVGWEKTIWVVLLASAGGIAVIILAKLWRSQPQHGIPFGPFIGYALFVAANGAGGL